MSTSVPSLLKGTNGTPGLPSTAPRETVLRSEFFVLLLFFFFLFLRLLLLLFWRFIFYFFFFYYYFFFGVLSCFSSFFVNCFKSYFYMRLHRPIRFSQPIYEPIYPQLHLFIYLSIYQLRPHPPQHHISLKALTTTPLPLHPLPQRLLRTGPVAALRQGRRLRLRPRPSQHVGGAM